MIRTLTFCAVLLFAWPVLAQSPSLADLNAAAQAGEAEAQFLLAERLRVGDGILQNYARAAELYQAASDQGDARATNALGALYMTGLGVAPDPVLGFTLLERAAQSGDAKHLFDLGSAYQSGAGTPANPAKAAELYQQASDLGWEEATVSLAVLYQSGEGVAQDYARAIELYTGPAQNGHTRALNNLGLFFVRGEGVEQNYEQAFKLFELAAERGMPTAMSNLGVLYQNGFGVEVNEDEANRLHRLAAQSSADTTALIYDERLAPADPTKLEAYLAAAKGGDPVAAFFVGYLIVSTAKTAKEYRYGARYLRAAADKGLPVAMADLGILTFEGKGVLQDFVEGYARLTVAAAGGLQGAIDVRDQFATQMTPAQINDANAMSQTLWKQLTLTEN